MWAEARKHEKKLRGLMVDYRRRAERRREFYDRIRSDPAAFLQIHGMQLRVHIDPNLCSMAESSLMPWMGDNNNMIDRFDVRAHLDQLDVVSSASNAANSANSATIAANKSETTDEVLDRQINYERYRNLVQNEFLGLNESKFLQQIWFEERFGVNQNQKEIQNKAIQSKKKLAEKKATIAYNYDNEDSTSLTVQTKASDSSESEESSDEDYDFDTTVNIDQLDNESGHRINAIALKFGMKNDDFVKYLDEDKTEAEKIRLQKELENEKSMFTGRKSRRERRALKEQRLLILRASNVEESDKLPVSQTETDKRRESSSDSEESVDENKIEFITSFGGSSEDDSRKESIERKEKEVMTKRKQKIKSLPKEKSESTVVYGPTLPGEDVVSSTSHSTSFHKSSHSKQRTYRFNESRKRSRTRSQSKDRHKYRRTGSRYHSRRTRSPSLRRSSNRTPDRYRERRSRSRDRRRRMRSRTRSRNRSRSRDRKQSRRRSRSRTRRSSSSSKTRRSRHRTRSRDRRDRSRGLRSRSRNRNRDERSAQRSHRTSPQRSHRTSPQRSQRTSPQRSHRTSPPMSRSIGQNNKETSAENEECISGNVKSIPSVPQTEKPMISEELVESKEFDSNIEEMDMNLETDSISEALDSQLIESQTLKEEKPSKVPSPPVRSYYRHDLCESGGSDEEMDQKKSNSETGEGTSRKRSNNTSSNALNTQNQNQNQFGYKSSSTVAVTPQERLKKKMQALIDRQYKLDKKAELEKLEKQQQEKEDREEELREMTSKLRYRRDLYRERRNSRSSSHSRSSSTSRSSSSSSSD